MKKNPKLFPKRVKVINPEVVTYEAREAIGKGIYSHDVIKGTFWKVTPTTWDEIFALQMLEHRVDKFAPKIYSRIGGDNNNRDGDGVIVTARALAIFDQR